MEKVYLILSKINTTIINPVIAVLIGAAFVYFLYGVFEYIWKSKSDPNKVKEGRLHMGWGLFGIFIMVSVFGLFRFLINTVPVSDRTKTNVNRVM